MQMKNPPHPGEMIGDSLGELGVSISDAAKGLGITRQQLHNLISGRTASRRKWPCGSRRRSAAPLTLGCVCR